MATWFLWAGFSVDSIGQKKLTKLLKNKVAIGISLALPDEFLDETFLIAGFEKWSICWEPLP